MTVGLSLTNGAKCGRVSLDTPNGMDFKKIWRYTLASARHYKMTEDERVAMARLKARQESLELYISGGSDQVAMDDVKKYEYVLFQVNEMKRGLLLQADEVDDELYDYTYYFDSVAGYIWVEDAE